MVNCCFCGEELKRNVFCSASHKVLYHRKNQIEKDLPIVNKPSDNLLKVNTVKEVKEAIQNIPPKKTVEFKPCKHGNVKELCKLCIVGK